MNSQNNDTPKKQLGNPLDPLQPACEVKAEALRSSMPEKETSEQVREGDTGEGHPPAQSDEVRVIPEGESQKFEEQQAEALKAETDKLFQDLLESDGWKIPKPLQNVVTLTLLVIAAVLGIYTVNQSVTFLQTLSTLPIWAQVTASLCMLTFGVIIGFVLLQIVHALLKLRTSPRINNAAIKKLRERQRLQQIASQHQVEAQAELHTYLKDYSLGPKTHREFQEIGMTTKEWENLSQVREELIDPNRPIAASDWIEEFQDHFQATLVTCAKRRIRVYSRRIGLGTAASPIPLIDRMIVLYGTLSMIKELCSLFNLKPAYGQSLTILSQSIIQTYLSGIAQESLEATAGSAMDFHSELAAKNATEAAQSVSSSASDAALDTTGASNAVSDIAIDTVGTSAGALIGFVGAKASEGTLNGLLIYRLGNKTIKMLKLVR